MLASYHGCEGVVRLLLARGAKVATRNKRGLTALFAADYSGPISVLLRAHGSPETC